MRVRVHPADVGGCGHYRLTWRLIRGDARHVSEHLEPESVDLIITSPPYFALRSYRDDGEHYDGQIGSEATPAEFVDALIACTAGLIVEYMELLQEHDLLPDDLRRRSLRALTTSWTRRKQVA